MAKVISEDTDLKSLLIEIIKKHDDLSLWVFDEWFYARGIDQNYTIDWEKVRRFYDLNTIRQNLS